MFKEICAQCIKEDEFPVLDLKFLESRKFRDLLMLSFTNAEALSGKCTEFKINEISNSIDNFATIITDYFRHKPSYKDKKLNLRQQLSESSVEIPEIFSWSAEFEDVDEIRGFLRQLHGGDDANHPFQQSSRFMQHVVDTNNVTDIRIADLLVQKMLTIEYDIQDLLLGKVKWDFNYPVSLHFNTIDELPENFSGEFLKSKKYDDLLCLSYTNAKAIYEDLSHSKFVKFIRIVDEFTRVSGKPPLYGTKKSSLRAQLD